MTLATEIVLPGVVEPPGLLSRTRELPAPRAGQVVLRMEATGVSFAEQQMRRGRYHGRPPFPFVPGYDLVGTVAAAGAVVAPAAQAGHAGLVRDRIGPRRQRAAEALARTESGTVTGKVILLGG